MSNKSETVLWEPIFFSKFVLYGRKQLLWNAFIFSVKVMLTIFVAVMTFQIIGFITNENFSLQNFISTTSLVCFTGQILAFTAFLFDIKSVGFREDSLVVTQYFKSDLKIAYSEVNEIFTDPIGTRFYTCEITYSECQELTFIFRNTQRNYSVIESFKNQVQIHQHVCSKNSAEGLDN